VNFVGECSGEIEDGETRECIVQDYVVALDEVSNGDGIGILSNTNKPQLLLNNDLITTTKDTSINNLAQQEKQTEQ
jgi:hypothetical protein